MNEFERVWLSIVLKLLWSFGKTGGSLLRVTYIIMIALSKNSLAIKSDGFLHLVYQ